VFGNPTSRAPQAKSLIFDAAHAKKQYPKTNAGISLLAEIVEIFRRLESG
jgi:hypothetical protein